MAWARSSRKRTETAERPIGTAHRAAHARRHRRGRQQQTSAAANVYTRRFDPEVFKADPRH